MTGLIRNLDLTVLTLFLPHTTSRTDYNFTFILIDVRQILGEHERITSCTGMAMHFVSMIDDELTLDRLISRSMF